MLLLLLHLVIDYLKFPAERPCKNLLAGPFLELLSAYLNEVASAQRIPETAIQVNHEPAVR